VLHLQDLNSLILKINVDKSFSEKLYLLQVNVYVTHNLLNILVQIANKMGFKIKISSFSWSKDLNALHDEGHIVRKSLVTT
jgi:hypothetical protein